MVFVPPELAPHQRIAAEFIKERPKCGIFLGIGAAKTLTTLQALYEIQPPGHILVVAPLAIARSTWIDEIEKWGYPIRTKSLIVDENDKKLNRKQRIEVIKQIANDPPTMYFVSNDLLKQASQKTVNYVAALDATSNPAFTDLIKSSMTIARDGLVIFNQIDNQGPINKEDLQKSLTIPKTRFNKAFALLRKNKLIDDIRVTCTFCEGRGCANCAGGTFDQLPPRKELIGYKSNGARMFLNTVEWPFSSVIIDESQSMKSHSSTRFKAMAAVAPQSTRIIELTGTPRPQSAQDLWSQMYLLDGGITLGKNFFDFRSKYFIATKEIDGRPVAWEARDGAEEEIMELCSPFVMSAIPSSIPMPDVLFDPNSGGVYPANKVNVTLPKELIKAYREFAKEQILILASPDPNDPTRQIITADSAAILVNKLVQFASGTMYLENDTGKREYAVIHDEKLQVLEHLINQASGPVLVGYRYQSERDEIQKMLRKKKIAVEIFDASRGMIKRWNAGQIPVMLIHPASGGPGLNLQDGGHELIWYTLPDSSEHFSQLNGRLIRPGQKEPVLIQYLAAKGTRDEAIAHKVLAPKLQGQQTFLKSITLDATQFSDEIDEIEDILGNLDIWPL